MFDSGLEFKTLDEIKEYCIMHDLTFKEYDGYSIKGKIYNDKDSEVGFVSDASLSSFKNKNDAIKWILCFT